MNLLLNNSYFKVSIVYSCLIRSTPVTRVIKKAFWPWEKDITEEQQSYTLEMDYVQEGTGTRYTYTSKHPDHSVLKTEFDSIMRQIKDQDSQYADKLLEDAIIGGGTKK